MEIGTALSCCASASSCLTVIGSDIYGVVMPPEDVAEHGGMVIVVYGGVGTEAKGGLFVLPHVGQ
jgi:hypothetical protein